jgi:hypothetical protein
MPLTNPEIAEMPLEPAILQNAPGTSNYPITNLVSVATDGNRLDVPFSICETGRRKQTILLRCFFDDP